MSNLIFKRGKVRTPLHGNGACYVYSQSELEYISGLIAIGYSTEAAIRDMRKHKFRFRQGVCQEARND